MKPALKKTCAILASVAGLFAVVVDANAKLEWETTELHASASAYDKDLKVRYQFVNKGDKPVTITSLQTSCGCVLPKVRNQVVTPGQSGDLEALVDLTLRQGKQTRFITVHTNDPENPKIVLQLLLDLPEVVKPSAFLVTWAPEESGTKKITVDTDEKVPVQELVVLNKDPNLDIKVSPEGPSKTYTVEFTPKPNTEHIQAKVRLQVKIADEIYKNVPLAVIYR